MRQVVALATAAALLVAAPPRRAAGEDAGPSGSAVPAAAAEGEIAWAASLTEAFAKGEKEGKPVFVAVNSERVDRGRLEPAAKELREHTYKDAAVVAKSRSFSCAILRGDGSSGDFGELRQRFGIEGVIVSPQHLFVHADGKTLIERQEYWPHAHGQPSVDALLALMDRALKAAEMRRAGGKAVPPAPAPSPGVPGADPAPGAPAPESAEAQRAAWIRRMLEIVRGTDAAARDVAVAELAKGDQGGDCLEPLCVAMLEAKDADLQVVILRALSRPGLELAVPAVVQLLDARDDVVRSHAAVTLEYVGSPRAVDALTKRLPRERTPAVFNDACRALGRCGAKQEAVRKTLLKELSSARSNLVFAGPAIGLAYFEKDAETARALEKVAKKEAGERFKRGYLLWALSEVGDAKSAPFVEKEILPKESFGLAVAFIRNVITVLEGGDDAGPAKGRVDGGMEFVAGMEDESIGGPGRSGRDQSQFKPKGEFTPRKWNGRGGGGVPGMGG
jgi:hypothetical protein